MSAMASSSFHHHHHLPYPNHHLQNKPNVHSSKLCMLSRSTPGVEALPAKCTQYVSYPRPAYTKQRPSMSTPSSQEEEEGEVRGLPLLLPLPPSLPLKIGILGFGNFGQFIGRGIQRQGHIVLATSRSDYSDYCRQHGIQFSRSMEMMCEEQPDVILVCSSILSTENVVRGIPMNKLNPDTVFVDVLSVKQFPRNLFLKVLPPEFGILCTHPMFGPESGKHGWRKLPFVYDKVRLTNSVQERKCADFLSIFEMEGCRMVEMSCEEHDHHAAGSQFITHTIGRILSHLDLESTPINTKGYETLLQLTENTVSESFDLYYGLFMYNVNATEQIENLDRAFEMVKQKLFGRLHDIPRKQIVGRVPMHSTEKEREPVTHKTKSIPYLLPRSDAVNDPSSSCSCSCTSTSTSNIATFKKRGICLVDNA